MNSSTSKLLALSTVAVLTFGACGSKASNSTVPATTSSAASATTDATPSNAATDSASITDPAGATDSASTTDQASASQDASAGQSASSSPSSTGGDRASLDPATATKAYKDTTLAEVLDGKTVQGDSLQVANALELDQVVSMMNTLGKAMQSAAVTPAACKTMTMANLASFNKDKARAVGVVPGTKVIVMLRDQATPAAAQGYAQAWAASNRTCSKYTMTMRQGKSSVKITATGSSAPVQLKRALDGSYMTTAVTAPDGTVSKQSGVTGTFGNVVIMATSSKQLDQKTLTAVVDEVAQLVADDMAH